MTTIERIKLPEPDTHCFDDDTNSDVWSYSRELVISTVLAHIDNLEAENERLRMQIVACGVVAMADTPAGSIEARNMHPDYKSASCDDVARRVDECITLRAEVERLKDLADSEGSRAAEYLRRARNAKAENERLNAIANSEGTRAAEYLRRARNVEDEAERLRKDAERYAALRLGQKWIVWMLLETRFDPKNLTLPSTQQ